MAAPGMLKDSFAQEVPPPEVAPRRADEAIESEAPVAERPARPGRPWKEPPYPVAARRPLRIFAFDPMLGRHPDNKITIEVGNERLLPGPFGERVQVVDYDGAADRFYTPLDLDNPHVLLTSGLEPSESDPRFHQQMVYAVAMKVLENFDLALGRRLWFRRRRPLRLFPHAFHGKNAFYDRDLVGVLFGYFRADASDVGENLPGQTVYTCLSHDIIAHEVTHALVDRLRPHFFEATNPDVLAFHEAFSDIVAIFQHFSFPDILARTVAQTRGSLRQRTPLVELARQFGYATGGGQALRDALDPGGVPDPTLYARSREPHDRGAVLVDAVFDAFFRVYQRRISDLMRIATGGTGQLPPGDLHPDLVRRIADEACKTAQSILTMCIRAFDYLPPVDVTFSDFLRGLVTADTDLVSRDRLGQRLAVIEAFRERGIYPQSVDSLGEEALVWRDCRGSGVPDMPIANLPAILGSWAQGWGLRRGEGQAAEREDADAVEGTPNAVAAALIQYARDNAARLELVDDPALKITLRGFHAVHRVSPDGQLLTELVAQFVQTLEEGDDGADGGDGEIGPYGGLPLRGGTTIVASEEGAIRYVISKPLPVDAGDEAQRARAAARRRELRAFVEECDLLDPRMPWADEHYAGNRMAVRARLASLHRRIRV